VILYLTFWFPAAYRARIVAVFMVAIPLSSFLGSPISGALLAMDGLLGLRGWQWLFIIEAIPAVLLGLVSFFGLPNKPADAKWLEPEARNWLDARLQSERSMAKQVGHMSLWQILTNKYVLILGLIYAGSSATSNALSMSNMETGFLNAIPFGIASVAMIFWGRYSDRSNAHAQNTAIPLALCATALLATMLTSSLPVTLAILSLVLIGNYSIKGPFWALATGTLSPATAAAGIAGINTLSHIGTSGAVWLLGVIKEATGSFPMALIPLALLQIAGIVAVLWINKQETLPATSAASPVH
jgi:MFS family permease